MQSKAWIGVAVVTVLAMACQAPSKQAPGPAKAPQPQAQAPKAPEPPPKPASEFDGLRTAIADWVDLLGRCDERWFARVEPSKIDNYEFPVDVDAMNAACEGLRTGMERMLDLGGFRNPRMDQFLRRAAQTTDRYLMMGFRAKKISVRDKLPYKQELTALRDGLRAEVAGLKAEAAEVQALTDADLNASSNDAPEAVVAWARDTLGRVRADFKAQVEDAIPTNKPVWRYGLKTTAVLAKRAAAALASARNGAPGAVVVPAQAMSGALETAAAYFTGEFFWEEDEKIDANRKTVVKAIAAYDKVAAKAFKKR
ncbi:MAG TPA: hypothetical protein PK313_03270 [Myxococcota bacterium]|mgnify:CR=1 FL=1|jgi:hypothetical protein|nr:hypothetical protein [Myxococcota bacterium]